MKVESDAFSGPGDALRPWLSAKKVYIRSTTIYFRRVLHDRRSPCSFGRVGVLELMEVRLIWICPVRFSFYYPLSSISPVEEPHSYSTTRHANITSRLSSQHAISLVLSLLARTLSNLGLSTFSPLPHFISLNTLASKTTVFILDIIPDSYSKWTWFPPKCQPNDKKTIEQKRKKKRKTNENTKRMEEY